MPIRIATAILFLAAMGVAVVAPAPSDLPSVALGQTPVYRLEVLLALFCGGLLVLTPLFQGVLHGRLPIEISHRGAKWDVRTPELLDEAERRVGELEAERSQMLQKRRQLKAAAEVQARSDQW